MTRRETVRTVAATSGIILLLTVVWSILGGDWDWKALIGWRALVDYIGPKNATGRKDAVQVYALLVAGVVAAITAAVGLLNLRLTRRNLELQRELEAQRAQGTALQAYYEQIGKLITDEDLLNTQRKEIRELARSQTLTVLQEVDEKGKASLLTFLLGAGLIGTETPAVVLTGADLREVALRGANITGVDLREANLWKANLRGASLWRANLQRADLRSATVTDQKLAAARSLRNATMPDGSRHP